MSDQSIKLGLALGLTTMGRWRGEPVAYLYNGVRLPKLPEWDKTKYPYAFISYSPVGFWTFFASPVEVFVRDSGVYPTGNDTHFGVSCSTPMFDDNPTTWGELGTNGFGPNAGKIIPLWCNFDMCNEDGTLYLEASKPVPVYE